MDLNQLTIITYLGFLAAFAYADLKYKKYIPAFSFEPLLMAFSVFSGVVFVTICYNLIDFPIAGAMLLGFVVFDFFMLYIAEHFKLLGEGDKLALIGGIGVNMFIFPLVLGASMGVSYMLNLIKKQKEIEFMPIWFAINLIWYIVLLTVLLIGL